MTYHPSSSVFYSLLTTDILVIFSVQLIFFILLFHRHTQCENNKEQFIISSEFLDLSNNIIEVVEEDSFIACTSLRELHIGQNNITFPFVMPASLKLIVLKINTMHRWPLIPKDITYIDISYNRLTEWYDDNVNFENLEVSELFLLLVYHFIILSKIKSKSRSHRDRTLQLQLCWL